MSHLVITGSNGLSQKKTGQRQDGGKASNRCVEQLFLAILQIKQAAVNAWVLHVHTVMLILKQARKKMKGRGMENKGSLDVRQEAPSCLKELKTTREPPALWVEHKLSIQQLLITAGSRQTCRNQGPFFVALFLTAGCDYIRVKAIPRFPKRHVNTLPPAEIGVITPVNRPR